MKAGEHIRKYQLESVLGEGGMGVVWKARDTELGRFVALKAIHEKFSLDPELRKRFIDEARIQARLVHQNICTLFDAFEENRRLYIVQEFVPGVTLKKMIEDARGPLPIEQVVKISLGVLAGLAYAHEEGVVHRDIKPSNIMVDGKGRVKIMDFGIAKALGVERMGKTKTGMTVGTPEYMSPEQILGKPVDDKSDIYSFGIVLYEMLTGKLPFDATSSEFEIQKFHIEGHLPALPDRVPEREFFQDVILMLTDKSAAQRPRAQHALQIFGSREPRTMIAKSPRSSASYPCPFPQLEQALNAGEFSVAQEIVKGVVREAIPEKDMEMLLQWCKTRPVDLRLICAPIIERVLNSYAPRSAFGFLSSGENTNLKKYSDQIVLLACEFFYLSLKIESKCEQVLARLVNEESPRQKARAIMSALLRERALRNDVKWNIRIAKVIWALIFGIALSVLVGAMQDNRYYWSEGVFFLVILGGWFLGILFSFFFRTKRLAHRRRLAAYSTHPTFTT